MKDLIKMHKSSLEGKYVKLRVVDEERDLSLLHTWRNNICEMYIWCNQKALITPQCYIDELRSENRHVQLMIIAKNCQFEKIIGTIFSYNYSPIDGTCFLSVFLDESAKGSVYGAEATVLFVDYLFTYFNIRKICSDIYEYNFMSRKSTERAGFVREGIFAQQKYYDGKYWDVYRYGLFRLKIDEIRNYILSIKNGIRHTKKKGGESE